MMNQLYHQINWQAPWYNKLAIPPLFSLLKDTFSIANPIKPVDNPVKDWLNFSLTTPIYTYQHHPIHFVAQDDLPANTAYETFIAQTGNIPTRDNFHDLLGGLIWLNFPKTKAVFNQLHQQDIEKNGIQPKRSLLRNILTLFDENGGVVVSDDIALLQALQSFDWQTCLYAKRQTWLTEHALFFPIGHALLEKLIDPRPNITAHVILLQVEPNWLSQDSQTQRQRLDDFLSQFFLALANHETLTSKMFQPLPVLGIPNFWQPQTLYFYQNKDIFRVARLAPPSPIYTYQHHES